MAMSLPLLNMGYQQLTILAVRIVDFFKAFAGLSPLLKSVVQLPLNGFVLVRQLCEFLPVVGVDFGHGCVHVFQGLFLFLNA